MTTILVGVDGSSGSSAALAWAAAEARLRDARLVLVYAWHLPAALYGGMGTALVDGDTIAGIASLAEEQLAGVCERAAPVLDGLEVERRVIEGSAAAVLLSAAAHADLLVVGTRGHGGFTGLLLGSVSQHLAHHSPCPLVIVPTAAAAS